MRNLLDYCYYFCYQFAIKNGTPSPKERAVFFVMAELIVLQLLAFILIVKLVHLFVKPPLTTNTTLFIILGGGLQLVLYNRFERYFLEKNRFKAITSGRYKPIKTPAFVDFLIMLAMYMASILLVAVIAFWKY
ncbi:hypothetical protein [Spirosoma linguale]|uniref:Uncharacterized protein n=1 Tax=Spirosoma linguale (strain ATCC 33905 / DSM 74 / LMG 10896 / Claus 1) TaxID=504472 RepID=D2QE27_SPILD|nr:hypothetical protein Slin_5273 [Spirosoma linguale DSM 74]